MHRFAKRSHRSSPKRVRKCETVVLHQAAQRDRVVAESIRPSQKIVVRKNAAGLAPNVEARVGSADHQQTRTAQQTPSFREQLPRVGDLFEAVPREDGVERMRVQVAFVEL